MESCYCYVNCGVSQSLTLGPKLFVLYKDGICNVSNVLKFAVFSGYTNVCYSHCDDKTFCTLEHSGTRWSNAPPNLQSYFILLSYQRS